MGSTVKNRFFCLLVLIGFAVFIAVVPYKTIIWDGGFPSSECRLKFVDSNGIPVPGVTLKVLTQAGGTCHFYPVDDYVPNHAPTSDAEGRMVFRHSAISMEFSGREHMNLIGFRFGETEAPQYDCVFTLGGREVFRTPFTFHWREWDEFRKPSVTRSWQPSWDVNKHGLRPNEDIDAWQQRYFDTNHDGKYDREERTAVGYCARWLESEMKPTEINYTVVERTIVIPKP